MIQLNVFDAANKSKNKISTFSDLVHAYRWGLLNPKQKIEVAELEKKMKEELIEIDSMWKANSVAADKKRLAICRAYSKKLDYYGKSGITAPKQVKTREDLGKLLLCSQSVLLTQELASSIEENLGYLLAVGALSLNVNVSEEEIAKIKSEEDLIQLCDRLINDAKKAAPLVLRVSYYVDSYELNIKTVILSEAIGHKISTKSLILC